MIACLAVGAGGFCGAILRYLLGLLPIAQPGGFPITTFFINLAGSFLIGFITQISVKNQTTSSPMTLFLKVGLCGGFTTFSTFALENYQLLLEGKTAISLLYMFLSFSACIAGVMTGMILGKKLSLS